MIYRFRGIDFDTGQRELRCEDEVMPIAPKPLSVLEYLIEHRDRMVPKSELLDAFWPANVSEAALQTTMSAIRRALGSKHGAVIKTHHGRGFRFAAKVEEVTLDLAADDALGDARPPVHLREQRRVTVLAMHFDIAKGTADHFDTALAAARERIEADQGRLMHMMIEGFTAVFGLANHAEDSARRAISCAWDLIASDAFARIGCAVACGVDAGPVVLADDADARSWNLPSAIEASATELARAAAPGTVLLSEAVLHQVRGEVEVRSTPHGQVLLSSPAQRAGTPVRPTQPGAKFVGRKAELAFLRTKAEAALAGSSQAVLLSGPPGIGKTRLVSEFLSELDASSSKIATVPCLPRLANTPLAPIRDICRNVLRAPDKEQLQDPKELALYARITDEVASPDPVLDGLSDQTIRQRSRALFARLVAASCSEAPIVLVVEDIHWMDPGSRAHIATLIAEADTLPLLLILTTRPTDTHPLTEGVMHLAPLGLSDCHALLRGLGATDKATAQALVDRSTGNPFFLEELAMAVGAGQDPVEVPETVQAVTEARIGVLDPKRRALLYAVSVIGPPAQLDVIAALLKRPANAVANDLGHLERAGFLVEAEDGVMFRHALLQDAAYGMISKKDRQRLHGDVARLLEQGQTTVRPETLALHWQEAGDRARAIACWIKASHAALYRSASQSAITFAQQGLELVDPDHPQCKQHELQLQLCLAPALMTRLGYGAAEVGRAYRRAHELCAETGDTKSELRMIAGLWVHTWVAGRLPESLSHARRLLTLAEKAGLSRLRLQSHSSIGAVLLHMSDFTAAREHLDAGMALIAHDAPDTVKTQNAAVTCAAYAAWVAALQGRPDAMRSRIRRCADLSQIIENSFSAAIHLALCANVLMCAREVDDCADLAERAVSLSRAHRYPFWLGTGLVLQGWAQGQQGEIDAALATIDEGIAVFEATGSQVQRANWFGLKAETLLAARRPEMGLKAIDVACRSAHACSDLWFLPRIHAVAASLHGQLGALDEAERHAARSASLAAANGLDSAFVQVPAPVAS